MSIERNLNIQANVRRQQGRLRVRLTERDTLFWRRAWGGLWGAGAVLAAASAMGTPTGMGASLDIMLLVMAATAAMGLVSPLLGLLLTLFRLPIPRLYAGGILVLLAGTVTVLRLSGAGWLVSLVLSAGYAAVGAAAGALLSFIYEAVAKRTWRGSGLPGGRLVVSAAALLLLLPAGIRAAEDIGERLGSSSSDSALIDGGGYATFTYGSGYDRREEFAEDAMLISQPVDASELLPSWKGLKKLYWGFDSSSLPLNGTVWLPESGTAAPLALILHGNHLAEQDSDKGYAYLGEALARNGYAAVSVDENFLNYSVWSDIPENDMQARAWLLLRHLDQLGKWAAEPGNPLYERLDLTQVALIGHSRGGQAAAMAAETSRNSAGAAPYRIQAVAALAPTDMTVDGRRAAPSGISYLVLHGDRDADLTDFNGERQFNRIGIAPGSNQFKAAVYMADANHSRFNSDWGTMDNSLPGGILLSQQDLLSGEQQREAASYFISGFMDAVFRDDVAAREEMLSPREDIAACALPAGCSIQYEDGSYRMLQDYEAPARVAESVSAGVAAAVEPVASRSGSSQDSSAGVYTWAEASGEGYYRLSIPAGEPIPEEGGLTFAAASLSQELCADSGAECEPESIALTLRVTDADGHVAQTSIDPVSAPLETAYMRWGWLAAGWSGGKYAPAAAAVLQSYRVPFRLLQALQPRFDAARLAKVEIAFKAEGDGAGRLMLDNIGWYRDDFAESSISPPG